MKKTEDTTPNSLLRKAREYKRWTQEDVAEKIGTTNVTISRWENGATFPGRFYRTKLCDIFDKTPEELGLTQDEEEPQMKTIFPFNEPLLEVEEMYGRQQESANVIARTFRKSSTSIVGPRRIGKTWLIQYLRLVALKELGMHFRIGFLDATHARCKTIAGFTFEALTKLGLPTDNAHNGLTSLDEGLQVLISKEIVPVLCVDEFEAFRKEKQEFNGDFFLGLRAMTQISNLVLIVISRKPLYLVVGKDGETSGFSNIFEQVTLRPFNRDVTKQFIIDKSRKAGFTQEEIAYLWEYGKEDDLSWSPIRLQLTGKILLQEQDQIKDNPDFKQVFEQRFEEIYQSLGNI